MACSSAPSRCNNSRRHFNDSIIIFQADTSTPNQLIVTFILLEVQNIHSLQHRGSSFANLGWKFKDADGDDDGDDDVRAFVKHFIISGFFIRIIF